MQASETAVDHVAADGDGASSSIRGRDELLARLEPTALAAVRAAAIACRYWEGRGDGPAADAAATDAMRTALNSAPGAGTVVVGEGAKDEAPMLYDGEEVGSEEGPSFDIAVDPLEGTSLCAAGLPGSLATIAVAPAGSIAPMGRSFYMEKLVGPPATLHAIDITNPPEVNLARAAEALEKQVDELRVVVLDKPRHAELTERLRRAGASVSTPPENDVAGALAALLPAGGADLLMGVGGTPEGVMTACAVRALGGFMQARLAPQDEDEERAVNDAGLSTERVYTAEELVSGDAFFAATGVTGGDLLRRPWRSRRSTSTESLVIAAGSIRYVVEMIPDAENGNAT